MVRLERALRELQVQAQVHRTNNAPPPVGLIRAMNDFVELAAAREEMAAPPVGASCRKRARPRDSRPAGTARRIRGATVRIVARTSTPPWGAWGCLNMERLGESDLQASPRGRVQLGRGRGCPGFRDTVLPLLRHLVPCDSASYNEVSPRAARSPRRGHRSARNHVRRRGGDLRQLHPPEPAGRGGAAAARLRQVRKFSDFISPSQLHRLELYDLVYAPAGGRTSDRPDPDSHSSQLIGLALNRRAPGLQRARPQHAWRPLSRLSSTPTTTRSPARSRAGPWPPGGRGRRCRPGGVRARRTRQRPGGQRPRDRWCSGRRPDRSPRPGARAAARLECRAPPRPRPARALRAHTLEVATPSATLTARFVGATGTGSTTILLSRRAAWEPGVARRLGLTARESEVLRLVAHGCPTCRWPRSCTSASGPSPSTSSASTQARVSSRTAAVAREFAGIPELNGRRRRRTHPARTLR